MRRWKSQTVLLIFTALLALLCLSGRAFAGPIIQDLYDGTIQISSFMPIGQSFTAEDAAISTIGIFVADANASYAPTDYSIDYYLYEGSGCSGTLLDSVSFTTLSDGFFGYADVDFSSVTLTVGDVYTICLANDTIRWAIASKGGNPYAGGNQFSSGELQPYNDLRFRVLPATSTFSCIGFEPPMDKLVSTNKKNRVLSLKMELRDESGTVITDFDINAPPIVEVDYSGDGPATDPAETYLPAGAGDEGNQFIFTDEGKWQFNLQTNNFSGSGTYTIKPVSGDSDEYVIDPPCEATFVIR